tara:strand:+ start:524 stop:1318 length:795 start_codon:yes stop_codon:yes gene_type:complete
MLVSDSYEIVDETIRANGNFDESLFYEPYKYKELPARLADIHKATDEEILGFARQWGLLGYSEMFADSLSPSDKKKFYNSPDNWGDPILWIKEHSRTIDRLITLLGLLANSSDECIDIFLTKWSRKGPQGLIPYSSGTRASLSSMGNKQSISDKARALITRIINSNTENYVSEVLVLSGKDPQEIARSYKSKVLLPLIYRHLGDAVVGITKFYRCNYRFCSKRWPANTEVRGPKNKYCPAEIGKESLCSRKERYERSKYKKTKV